MELKGKQLPAMPENRLENLGNYERMHRWLWSWYPGEPNHCWQMDVASPKISAFDAANSSASSLLSEAVCPRRSVRGGVQHSITDTVAIWGLCRGNSHVFDPFHSIPTYISHDFIILYDVPIHIPLYQIMSQWKVFNCRPESLSGPSI